MRILVISDIHSNLVALEAVLAAAGKVDATWCLGDLVGYGPSPNECVALVSELPNLICLQGNHDAAAIGELALDSFNLEARTSIDWLLADLNSASTSFLKAQPQRAHWEKYTLVHGSPRRPLLEYLLDTHAATQNFRHFDTDFCFVGHTHIPAAFRYNVNTEIATMKTPLANSTQKLKVRGIINPGSVGQPRDGDPRAAFAILDSELGEWEFRRIEYDIFSVQKRMQAAHLPERHISRLESGW